MISLKQTEVERVDEYLSAVIDQSTREQMWRSVESILSHGPVMDSDRDTSIGLALGYVQSGKTSSMVALQARAADQGYRIIVALLGGTNLLLDQNQERISDALGINRRTDYRWIVEQNPQGRMGGESLREWLARDRIIFVPILKHAARINGVAEALLENDLSDIPILFIDDEADQASLNTKSDEESTTYKAISALRSAAPKHLYVQYTATPYAPLLLEPDDQLLPQFVEFLTPGPGYVGGREFFIDEAETVVRNVPSLDEQRTKLLSMLPESLMTALGSFISGAALLMNQNRLEAPISMLVHSTQRVDIQNHYYHMIKKLLGEWRRKAADATTSNDLPKEIIEERQHLVSSGVPDLENDGFLEEIRYVLAEATPWLINSLSDQNKVNWHIAPVHILVGGNKLDRGFTIEGLTVSYMNRPTSPQIDTMEQRARAFGYRKDLLPFCQFFATKRTVNVLRDIVFTEYDLRAQLQDHIDNGGNVSSWAKEIGLLLPPDTRPSRPNVVKALSVAGTGWQSMRMPDLSREAREYNHVLVKELGLFEAPFVTYGRLSFRTLEIPLSEVVEKLLLKWSTRSYSPGWRHDDILASLNRNPDQDQHVLVALLESENGPRVRQWDEGLGFVNLFQGRDLKNIPGEPFYPGDRNIGAIEENPGELVLQIHRVIRREQKDDFEILTPAMYLGNRSIIRK